MLLDAYSAIFKPIIEVIHGDEDKVASFGPINGIIALSFGDFRFRIDIHHDRIVLSNCYDDMESKKSPGLEAAINTLRFRLKSLPTRSLDGSYIILSKQPIVTKTLEQVLGLNTPL